MSRKNGAAEATQATTTIELSVFDRYTLAANVLAAGQGSLSEILRVDALRERLYLSVAERSKCDAEQVGEGQFKWNPEKDFKTEFTLTPEEMGIIKLSIQILGARGGVSYAPNMIRLVRKFFTDKELEELSTS